ncbi:MAG: ArgE/DapE family deacylase [Candidatus Kariarchaeaceae archaeon]|jgi:acetylornithine deacetylase
MKLDSIEEEELLSLLQKLISIESTNPSLSKKGSGENEIANFLGEYMENLGLTVAYQLIDEKRKNVIGLLKGKSKGKSLILNAHTDTVGVEGMQNPFNPKFEDGRVYGRGAIDMKSGIAAILLAVESIINSGIVLKGDVILAFVVDEEYASIGTEELLREYSADAAIITEPTNLQITIAHKGFAWIKIKVHGRAAHGSLPEEGIDAIVKAGKILIELENLQQRVFPKKAHSLLGPPSIHASLISGGTELSTYPDYCEIQIERRTLPGENQSTVEMEMDEILNAIREEDNQFQAECEVFFYRPALEIDKDHPIVNALDQARTNILQRKSKYIGKSWWMDSALLSQAGIPTVVFGPEGIGLHAIVEYVEFDSVISTVKILTQTVIDYCGVT